MFGKLPRWQDSRNRVQGMSHCYKSVLGTSGNSRIPVLSSRIPNKSGYRCWSSLIPVNIILEVQVEAKQL